MLQIQGQRAAQQQAAKEKAAVGKLEAIKKDHEKRLGTLSKEAESAELKVCVVSGTRQPRRCFVRLCWRHLHPSRQAAVPAPARVL